MISHEKAIRLDAGAVFLITCIEDFETALAFANVPNNEDFDTIYEAINSIRNSIVAADETSCH